jgi:hypothetical protein
VTGSTVELPAPRIPLGDTGAGDGPTPAALTRIDRAGTAEAALQVLVIQPADAPYEDLELGGLKWEDDAVARPPRDHLDTDPFVHAERAKALAPPAGQARVKVTLPDGRRELPHDSPAELRELIEDIYLFDGRDALRVVLDELRLMVRILERPGQWSVAMGLVADDAPSGGRAPADAGTATNVPGLHEARARYDELVARIGTAGLAQATVWRDAFDATLRQFHVSLVTLMQQFELAVSKRAIERLEMHRRSLLVQTSNYFDYFRLREYSSVEATLRGLNAPPIHAKDPFVKALKQQLTDLKPLAEAVGEAQQALQEAPSRFWDPSPFAQKLDAARARLSVAVATAASVHPILYRFNVDELIHAEGEAPAALGEHVFARLQRSWNAAGTIKSSLFLSRPASHLKTGDLTADTIPEELVAASAKGSMWTYRKLTDAALATCDPEAAVFLKRALANVGAAHEADESKRHGAETTETVELVALSLALHAACPPLALALDLATSVRDVYGVASDRAATMAEAWCYLNPRDCLIDDPPSAWPLALALAGAVMTVAV